MLEGLDQIDWKNIGYHIWGNRADYLEKLPERIRDLSSPDENIQDQAITYVLGEKGTFGIICDTTPYIVPYIIEILSTYETPRRRLLIEYLVKVLEHVPSSRNLSVPEMRLNLKVYDSFIKNTEVLLHLMDDKDEFIQIAVIELVGNLTGDSEMLLVKLLERFSMSPNEEIQVALLRAIKSLLSSLDGWMQNDIKEKYAPILRDIVDTSSSKRVQLAAVRASVETINRYRKEKSILSSKVPDLLAEEFIYHSSGNHHLYWSYTENQLNYSILIIRDLVQLGYEPLLTLLKEPKNNAFQVHLIIRGLLASVLMSDEYPAYWISTMSHTKEGMYYLPNYRVDDYRAVAKRKDKTELLKKIWQAILENAKTWEIPTNMFSFFFGLPNSRDELQKIFDDLSLI